VKGAPLSVPLVSTGPIETTHHGWLINSDTTILYGAPQAPATGGNDVQKFPRFSGARLTAGYWLDDSRQFAIEASGFALERRSAGFNIRGDEVGSPVINIPVYNTIPYAPPGRTGGLPPAEDGLPASLTENADRFDGNAGVFTGGVKITNSLRLWGADATGVATFFRNSSWTVSALAGFRYLDLSESFNLFYDSVGRGGVYLGQSGTAWDQFKTSNRFFGATLGLRTLYLNGPFSIEMSGRLGIGANYQVIDIGGGFTSLNYITPIGGGPQGVFAQPANEGRYSAVDFAVVPEAQIKFGYNLTPSARITIGYDVLYESSVVRPTDQINRNLPKGQTFQQGGTVSSSTSPTRLFNTTDFYAHGISAGLSVALAPEKGAMTHLAPMALPPRLVDWSGWYLGGNAGWTSGGYSGNSVGSPVPPFSTTAPDVFRFSTLSDSMIIGGGQIGFNWQLNQWVFGLEGSIARNNLRREVLGPGSAVFGTNDSFQFSSDWEAALRARVGFAFDRWLAYGTAGVAGLRASAKASYGSNEFQVPGGVAITPPSSGADEHILLGGTVGLGAEYALTSSISAGMEYRYSWFGSQSYSLGSIPFPGPGGVASSISSRVAETTNEITIRINYRFPTHK
jgi:opacity protein-like surface antigen